MTTMKTTETRLDLEKLYRLRAERDAMFAVRRDVSEAARLLHQQVGEIESEQLRARQDDSPHKFPAQELKRLERLRAETKKVQQHDAALERRQQNLLRLVDALDGFARDNGIDLNDLPFSAGPPAPDGPVPNLDELDDVRGRIRELAGELKRLARMPASESEAFKAIDYWIDGAAERVSEIEVASFVHGKTVSTDGGSVFNLFLRGFDGAEWKHNLSLVEGLFAALVPTQLRKLLRERVTAEAKARGGWGLDASAHAERVRVLENELFALQLEEEQLVMRFEGHGMPLERRPDADPRAVLEPTQ